MADALPNYEEELSDGGFSKIKTSISGWQKELERRKGAQQDHPEERRLRIPERWTERFKTIMRGEPYKAALLGLPLIPLQRDQPGFCPPQT